MGKHNIPHATILKKIGKLIGIKLTTKLMRKETRNYTIDSARRDTKGYSENTLKF